VGCAEDRGSMPTWDPGPGSRPGGPGVAWRAQEEPLHSRVGSGMEEPGGPWMTMDDPGRPRSPEWYGMARKGNEGPRGPWRTMEDP
jgi:hypothetical protein